MKKNRLISDFYELQVKQVMDKRVWDLPVIEENDDIGNVFNILGARNHIWVVKNKKEHELVGVITEHDVLRILAPKDFPTYVFGMPDVRSIQHGTANTAKDVMCHKIVTCNPDEKIVEALTKMRRYNLRRLPVVKDGRIVGEITLNHLIRKYYAASQYIPIVDKTDEEKT